MLMRAGECVGVATSRNLLLAGLSAADAALVRPHATPAVLRRDDVLLDSAIAADAVFFPEAGVLSVAERTFRYGLVEIAVIGREGLAGWPALLGDAVAGHEVVARGGEVRGLRIAIAPLLAACRASVSLRLLLLGFVNELMTQMANTIVSQTASSIEQRLARWLLMRHDRVGGDGIEAHHAEISEALCVRRASITDALHILEGNRLIRNRRGLILVRDRPGLQRCAGSIYQAPAGPAARWQEPMSVLA